MFRAASTQPLAPGSGLCEPRDRYELSATKIQATVRGHRDRSLVKACLEAFLADAKCFADGVIDSALSVDGAVEDSTECSSPMSLPGEPVDHWHPDQLPRNRDGRKLPAEHHAEVMEILLSAASAGAVVLTEPPEPQISKYQQRISVQRPSPMDIENLTEVFEDNGLTHSITPGTDTPVDHCHPDQLPRNRKPASVLKTELMMLFRQAVAQGSIRVTSQSQSMTDNNESEDATVKWQQQLSVREKDDALRDSEKEQDEPGPPATPRTVGKAHCRQSILVKASNAVTSHGRGIEVYAPQKQADPTRQAQPATCMPPTPRQHSEGYLEARRVYNAQLGRILAQHGADPSFNMAAAAECPVDGVRMRAASHISAQLVTVEAAPPTCTPARTSRKPLPPVHVPAPRGGPRLKPRSPRSPRKLRYEQRHGAATSRSRRVTRPSTVPLPDQQPRRRSVSPACDKRRRSSRFTPPALKPGPLPARLRGTGEMCLGDDTEGSDGNAPACLKPTGRGMWPKEAHAGARWPGWRRPAPYRKGPTSPGSTPLRHGAAGGATGIPAIRPACASCNTSPGIPFALRVLPFL
jgi:hypothetical protein